MYEVMAAWETMEIDGQSDAVRDFAAVWRAASKVVFSRGLGEVSSARTRLERVFDPERVRDLKRSARRDLGIGGPTLAGEALRAGLVDEMHLILAPVVVGGGTPALPGGLRLDLDLIDTRRFADGMAHLRYRVGRIQPNHLRSDRCRVERGGPRQALFAPASSRERSRC